jgi:hypothetical protein
VKSNVNVGVFRYPIKVILGNNPTQQQQQMQQKEATQVRTVNVVVKIVESRMELVFKGTHSGTMGTSGDSTTGTMNVAGGAVSTVQFGSLYYGQQRGIRANLVNNSPFRSTFAITKLPRDDDDNSNQQNQDDDDGDGEGGESHAPLFSITPTEGQIDPFEQIPVQFTFKPLPRNKKTGFKSQPPSSIGTKSSTTTPVGIPPKSAIPPIKYEGYKEEFMVEVAETEQKIEFSLQGRALKSLVQLSDKNFRFGYCPVNEHNDVLFSIRNCNDLPLEFSISRVAHFHASPAKGILQPLEIRNITLTFQPNQLGRFSSKLLINLAGLKKVYLNVSGFSEQIAEKKQLIGGIDKVLDDFTTKPHFVMHKPSMETGNLEMHLYNKAPPKAEKKREKYFTIDLNEEVPMDQLNEFKKKKENHELYNTFIRTKKSTALAETVGDMPPLKVQINNYFNDTELGMIPGSGLESPKPIWKTSWGMGGPSDKSASSQDGADNAVIVRKPRKFDENKIVKKKFKPAPTNPNELRECKAKLTPKMINRILTGPKMLDFGTMTVHATGVKSFGITNELKQYILVQVVANPPQSSEGSQQHGEEVVRVVPDSQIIPPLCTTGFDIIFCSEAVQVVQQTMYLTINEHSKIKFNVIGDVVPTDVALSTNEVRFRFNDYSLDTFVTESVTLTNRGNSIAEYVFKKLAMTIDSSDQAVTAEDDGDHDGAVVADVSSQLNDTLRSHSSVAVRSTTSVTTAGGTRKSKKEQENDENLEFFSVKPMRGEIEPFKSATVEITYRPYTRSKVEQLFGLDIKGSNEQKTLRCIGDMKEPKIAFLEKKLDYGVTPVGLRKQKALTLKNVGDAPGVFNVEPLTDVRVTPMKGRIVRGSTQKLLVELKPSSSMIYHSTLTINIRGGKTLIVPIRAEAKIPIVEMENEDLQFGDIFVGSTGQRKITLTNGGGNIPAILKLDLTRYSDFTLMNDRGELITETSDGDEPIIIVTSGNNSDEEMDDGGDDEEDDDDDDFEEEAPKQSTSATTPKDAGVKLQLRKVSTFGDDSISERGSESGRETGCNFRITVEPNSSLTFYLCFKPRHVDQYDFKISFQVAGIQLAQTGLMRQVKARSLKPRLVVSHHTLDFKHKVIITEATNMMPHRMLVTFTNEDRHELVWEFDIAQANNTAICGTKDRIPLANQDVFRIEPTSGRLTPGQASHVQVFFTPLEANKEYLRIAPIYLDKQREKSYFDLQLQGMGSNPTLSFDIREITFPVCPLGITSKQIFNITNEGYEELNLQYRLPTDTAKIPLTLTFPEGNVLSIERTAIPVELSFMSTKPISFTANVQFFDGRGQTFTILVTCTADNCLLTNYSFLIENKDAYRLEAPQEKNKPIMLAERPDRGEHRVGTASSKRGNDGEFNDALSSSHSAMTANTAMSSGPLTQADRTIRRIYNKRNAERLLNWLNVNALTNPVDDLIKTLLFSNGGILYDMLYQMSSKKAPGRVSKLSSNRTDSLKELMSQYEQLLTFLKSFGALLNVVRPEYLLRYDDYIKVISMTNHAADAKTERPDSSAPSTGGEAHGGTIHSARSDGEKTVSGGSSSSGGHVRRLTERRFRYKSFEAWMTVIFQMIKIFVLNRVNVKQLKQTPGCEVITSEAKTPSDDPVTTNYFSLLSNEWSNSLASSNVISVPESIILAWMTFHYNKIHNQPRTISITSNARNDEKKSGENTNARDLPQVSTAPAYSTLQAQQTSTFRLTNFGNDLRNGKVLAAVLQSHIPSLANKFESMRTTFEDISDLEYNASLVVNAVREARLDYTIRIRDIVQANPRDMLLFCIYLFQTLPQYIPRATLVFEGNLQELIRKSIELTNPTKHTLEYQVSLEGSSEFTLVNHNQPQPPSSSGGIVVSAPTPVNTTPTREDKIALKPKANLSFPIEVKARFSKPVEDRLTFHAIRSGSYQAPTMVFMLRTQVLADKFLQLIKISSQIYEVRKLELEIDNPFERSGNFTITLKQSIKANPDAGPTTQMLVAQNVTTMPEGFWCPSETVNLKRGERKKVTIQFLPFLARCQYTCQVLFSDPKVGEFVIGVEAQSEQPEVMDKASIKCESNVSNPRERGSSSNRTNNGTAQIAIAPLNHAVEKATNTLKERYKKFRIGRSIVPIPDQESIVYQVEYSSPFFSGPKEVTLHRKHALAPVNNNDASNGGTPAPPQTPAPPSTAGAPDDRPVLNVTFTPREPGLYPCHVILSSPFDYRVYEVEGRAIAPGVRVELEFCVPVRQKITQEIPLNNKSDRFWKIQATLSGDFFYGPSEMRIPPHTVMNYPLVFYPKTIAPSNVNGGMIKGELELSNVDTLEKYIYALRGKTMEPLAEGRIALQCKVREPIGHSIKVPNINVIKQNAITYRVEVDIPFVTGKKEHIVPGRRITSATSSLISFSAYTDPTGELAKEGKMPVPNKRAPSSMKKNMRKEDESIKEEDYVLSVLSPLGGTYNGTITFIAPDGEQLWYALDIVATRAPMEKSVRVESVVRQPTRCSDILLSNPLDEPVTFQVTTLLSSKQMEGGNNSVPSSGSMQSIPYLEGPRELRLEAHQKDVPYQFTYSPLIAGEVKATVSFYNELAGEFWYELVLVAKRAAPIIVPAMSCVLGKQSEQEISITNPTNERVVLDASFTQPEQQTTQNFSLQSGTSGPVTQLVMQAYETIRAKVLYLPSSIEPRIESAELSLSHRSAGTWTFQLQGSGKRPTQMETHSVYGQISSNASSLLTFRNPFPVEKKVVVKLVPYVSTSGAIAPLDSSTEEVSTSQSPTPTPSQPERVVRNTQLRKTQNTSNVNTSTPQSNKLPPSPIRLMTTSVTATESVFRLMLKNRNSGITVAPFASLQIPFTFSPLAMREYNAMILVTTLESSPNAGDEITWKYIVNGVAEATTTETFGFKCQARTSIEKVIQITLPSNAPEIPEDTGETGADEAEVPKVVMSNIEEEYTHEIIIPDTQNYLKAIKRSLTFTRMKADSGPNSNSQLLFKVEFAPLRPFQGIAQLLIHRKNGGLWRYELQLDSQVGELDDTIEVQSSIGRTERVSFRLSNIFAHQAPFEAYFTSESSVDLTVSPTRGTLAAYGYEGTPFLISFTANSYGKVATGVLVIDTEEMQWRYAVRGVLPKYVPPKMTSKIENKLNDDTRQPLDSKSAQPRGGSSLSNVNTSGISTSSTGKKRNFVAQNITKSKK